MGNGECRLWESQSPDDPELYPARFNYFMNRARSSVLVLNGADGVGEDESEEYSLRR